ncbi:LPS-assembly protein [Cricetibacter osteomyelitidis]|uniref:LPS-assembly protein LptD n=1 Tax=Cricetibacter osteomyelitidis TaxID=1521931 RepID=A0A4R2T1A7_9PAST|nr:LPS assembly protein LptD [Cricetibacter osteomyelitidis]TCP94886.1 LPS-assembly protein [Cricetibacter osteomyelitidis]
MKKHHYTLLSLSILTALYSTGASADLQSQCLHGVPYFSGEPVQGDPNELPVYIEADDAVLNQPTNAKYIGNVDIKQGNRHLTTDSAEIIQSGDKNNPQRVALVNGNIDYKDDTINLLGSDAKINLNTNDTNLKDADYQLVNRQGRGTAEEVEIRQRYRKMKNATFTSCLPNDDAWTIQASEMTQDLEDEVAEMWHARFKVKGVPIFYTPYLQLPIGDRRRSGLLIPPEFGHSSRDGFFYGQPIYWNIAPNYDATFTPKYMTSRGWQLNGEFRYLTHIGEGKFAGEYINDDRYTDYTGENRSRHLFYWQHSSSFLQNWRLNVNYTKVSDKRYFNDFDSDYGSSTDGYATQYARIAYYQPNWNFSVSAKQYQIFDENVNIGPYKALPQIDFNYYKNDLLNGWVDFKLYSQAVHFDNDSALMPTAWRFHAEPSLNIPLSNSYGSLNIETKLYATHYQQKKGKGIGAENVERRVNRTIPQLKVDLQTVLATKETFIKDYTQTIEPHVQYLYRPYRNQNNIGSSLKNNYLGYGYDSSLLQQDYFALFRDRRYSGLDRIASANQITVGGTTRIFDKNANERFNLSLGQIYYINPSRIDDSEDSGTAEHSSSWALESNWKINNEWNWRGSYQYDTRLNETSLANMTLEYNPEKMNLVQLSYRFASQRYIDQNLGSAANSIYINGVRYGQNINQVGMTVAWEVADNWALVGRYYHDIALNKPIEQYAGVQYSTCCWSAGVGVRRYATSKSNQAYSDSKDVFYDNSVHFTVELRGLGSSHHSGISRMLDRGLIPYTKPFDL